MSSITGQKALAFPPARRLPCTCGVSVVSDGAVKPSFGESAMSAQGNALARKLPPEFDSHGRVT
jgi:hypothetical protein